MNQPKWNKDDREGSLIKWIDILNAEARRQFLDAGTHLEIFFLFNDEGLMNLVPVAGMEKEDIVRKLKKTLHEKNGYAYIHIVEAATRIPESGDQADSLLLLAESRDGFSRAWVHTVVQKGDEKMLMNAVEVDGDRLQGRFTGIFEK